MGMPRIVLFLLLLVVYEAEDVSPGERASANGANPSVGAPRVQARNVEDMQAGCLPDNIALLYTHQTNGADILILPQLTKFSPR
jgi:hypothetical protein